MKSKFIPFLLIAALLISSCSGEQSSSETVPTSTTTAEVEETDQNHPLKQEVVIERPFQDLDVPFKTFNYNPNRTNVYEMPSGTRIEVPKNAFVDENGKTVDENITLDYREMHDLVDIMISGIKMGYEEEDTTGDFESAGMFEIRANSGGEELELKKGKEIKVDFASYKDGDFKSYAMNEATANWEFIEQRPAVPNMRKQERMAEAEQRLDELEFICQVEPRQMKKTDKVVDLNYDFNEHPELEIFNSAMWIIAGGKAKQDEFNKMGNNFYDIEIAESDSCNFFQLTFVGGPTADGSRSTKAFLAQPVWGGKAYRKAKKNYKKKVKEYEKLRKKLERDREVASREADLIRKFRVKGMGIFNCDRIMNFIKFSAAALVLTCKDKIKNFFFVTLKRRASIKFYDPTVDDFKYDPDGMNSIIAILPDNKIGTVSEEEFDKAVEKLKSKQTDKLELELKVEDEPVKTKKDVKKYIPAPRF